MPPQVQTIVCAPAWDRWWCVDLWVRSIRANLDLRTTGLVVVCPSGDSATRDQIAEHTAGFAWVEVVRDKLPQTARELRHEENHVALAAARNQALAQAIRARPRWIMMWDADVLLAEGAVDRMRATGADYTAAWIWLDRQPPRRMKYMSSDGFREVLWQPPGCFSAMKWSSKPGRPQHYRASEFTSRVGTVWECAVATGAVLMTERAWRRGGYKPHPDGAHVPFCLDLERAGVSRKCNGDVVGVHLYDGRRTDEIEMGWPDVMQLAQQWPLASQWHAPRSLEFEALGFFDIDEKAEARSA